MSKQDTKRQEPTRRLIYNSNVAMQYNLITFARDFSKQIHFVLSKAFSALYHPMMQYSAQVVYIFGLLSTHKATFIAYRCRPNSEY